MTATIIQMDDEVRAAIEEKRLTKIDITEAQLKLANGTLSLRASDLLPPKIKSPEEAERAKTNKERQAEFVLRKKEGGFSKGWVHESIDRLANEEGGQEFIEAAMNHYRSKVAELTERVQRAEDIAEHAQREVEFHKTRAEATKAAESRAEAAERRAEVAEAQAKAADAKLAARRWWRLW